MLFPEYVQSFLRRIGVDTVFGVPGSYIMPVWQSFSPNQQPRLVTARHECGAVYMADGWSRISGKPGVVLTTTGPGVTNAVTGVACAYKDSIPLLILSGQASTDSFGRGVFQECFPVDRGFSLTELMRPITKATLELTNAHNAAQLLERALHIACSGRPGPVFLSLPLDIQKSEVAGYSQPPAGEHRTGCDPTTSVEILEAIRLAERPLLLVGWGSYLAQADEQLVDFIHRLQIPTLTTLKGKSAISGNNPLVLGHVGPAEDPRIRETVESYNPDLIITLGSSLADSIVGSLKPTLESAAVIQVDRDPLQLGARVPAHVGICADIRNWLNGILDLMTARNLTIPSRERLTLASRATIATATQSHQKQEWSMAAAINHLNELLPLDSIVVPDAGNHWLNTLSLYTSKARGGIQTNAGLGPMGHAISSAIGMAFADETRPIVCVTGDSSVLMAGSEISVAAEHGRKSLFIIFENAGMGRIRIAQQVFGKIIGTAVPQLDYRLWALSMGVQNTFDVADLNDFANAVQAALRSDGTSVIVAHTSQDEIPVCLRPQEQGEKR